MELVNGPLGLLVLAALFAPLERWRPIHPRKLLRPGWQTDVAHFFLTHTLSQLSLVVAVGLVLYVVDPLRPGLVEHQPHWLQLPEAVLLLELVGYWCHRAFHEVPWLWRIHAVHHSSEHLDWLAALRVHPLDQTLTRATQFTVLSALGFPFQLTAGATLLLGLWAVFLHANVRARFGPLERLVATPAFHHWHHAHGRRGNYAGLLPWVDALFGTAIVEAGWPERHGADDPPRPTWWGHLTLARSNSHAVGLPQDKRFDPGG